jgi:hypothetical protein
LALSNELLEPLGPSPSLVGALTQVAFVDLERRRCEDAIRLAERALRLAKDLGLPRPSHALGIRGRLELCTGTSGA